MDQRGGAGLDTADRESARLSAKFRSHRAIVITASGYRVDPKPRSQFNHATPPPARRAAPSAVQTPVRALVAAPWWPFAVAIAHVRAQMMSMRMAMMSTIVNSAPITVLRSLAPPTPPKSGNTSMGFRLLA